MAELGLPLQGPTIRPALDRDALIRSVLLGAVFLLLWISLRPFIDLSDPPEITEAGTLANQIVYPAVLVILLGWCLAHEPQRLKLLLRPIFVATLLWIALSVVTSWEPSLAARRYLFTLVVIGISSIVLLLPRNTRDFADVLAGVVLIVLVLSYLGVFFLPSVSIHQASDFAEPELAGDWRGVFGHKNGTSVAMVSFIFIGLFVASVRSRLLGGLIMVLATIFLAFTGSKSAVGMLPLVLILSVILKRVSAPIGIILSLSGILIFNILSVGTIFFTPARVFIEWLLPDPTFTGRTEVWEFVFPRLAQHPITGYGYEAFWSTPEVVYGMGENQGWANVASHAHNGFLDLALTIGIPGAILVTLWLVVFPLVDFYRCPTNPAEVPLKMLFLRVCLFAAYESNFESVLSGLGAHPLLLFTSVFGLRYLSMTRPVI